MITTEKERRDAIDYVKAIGIIAVVIGHYKHDIFDVFKPYLYHMPLFFFVGGLLFNTKKTYTDSIKNVISKYWLYIVINYIFIGTAAVIYKSHTRIHSLQQPFDEGILSTIRYAIEGNMHTNGMFLVAWFLLSYSFIYLIFTVITKTLSKLDAGKLSVAIFFISIIAGMIGYFITSKTYISTKVFYFNNISQILVGGMFFGFGFCSKKYIFKLLHPNSFLLAMIILIALTKLNLIYPMSIAWSKYELGVYNLILPPLLCIYCVFFISSMISKSTDFKLLKWIGKNTKPVMSYHLLSFLILDSIFSIIGVYDLAKSSALSHYNNSYIWWLYVAFGTIAPIVFQMAFNKFIISTSGILNLIKLR
ncbi:MAG: acyltransferase family protein [Hafnia alvei]|uniref:acyltransferase family protein n=1 Tax=Hafnia alvei TaxID=569 RepID=UPI0029079DF6|nr:acyltransferase family protein [Hafnia alvei]MDU7480408.1 acyltransferase family protein [Hafnia alvei]